MIIIFQRWWKILKPTSWGRWLFSLCVGYLIPYTGSICPRVLEVGPGFARVMIKDRRKVRNHLKCIHALALANLGELTTGLALHFALESNQRAILTHLGVQFVKKARGGVTAKCKIEAANLKETGPKEVVAHLFDHNNILVAQVSATWLVDISIEKKAKTF